MFHCKNCDMFCWPCPSTPVSLSLYLCPCVPYPSFPLFLIFCSWLFCSSHFVRPSVRDTSCIPCSSVFFLFYLPFPVALVVCPWFCAPVPRSLSLCPSVTVAPRVRFPEVTVATLLSPVTVDVDLSVAKECQDFAQAGLNHKSITSVEIKIFIHSMYTHRANR